MCFFTAIEAITKTEVGTRAWGSVVIVLTMFCFGGIWDLLLLVRKAVKFFRYCLMYYTFRNMENTGAEGDFIYVDRLKRFERRRILVCCPETGFVIF